MTERRKGERSGSIFRELLGWIFYFLIIIGLTYIIITYVGQRTAVEGYAQRRGSSARRQIVLSVLGAGAV